jgi:type VI secretion system secreted protein Hcp
VIRLRRFLALVMLAPTIMWAWGVDAHAQDQTFVSISTIPGESTDASHTNWIDAYALDTGISMTGTTTNFSDVLVLKGLDKASPKFHDALVRWNTLSSVIIEVCRAGTLPEQCYYRVELSNANVTSVDQSGSSCVGSGGCTPTATESVHFTYTQIKWIYTPWSGGSPGTQVINCWNVTTHQRC